MTDLDSLKSLQTSLIDAIRGYDTAVESAESGEVKAILNEIRTLHVRSHNDLDALLQSKGEIPDESGSFMSSVHKAVIAVRSATTGIDYSSLSSFADGEERILESYDAAIQKNQSDSSTSDLLTRQREGLQAMIVRMKDLSQTNRSI